MITHYLLSKEVLTYIIKESERMYPQETGGVLIGRFEKEYVLIDYATAPGPDAQHTTHEFKRDGIYCQEVLDRIVAESEGLVDYIGEWHSHPSKSRPSSKDVMAMRWIANNKKYAIQNPIMCICMQEHKEVWKTYFYLYNQFRLNELVEVPSSPNGN
ncbi:MAG: Mov34/MPN/PAD-1 family protein [Anaerolineae bacterium]|nr:Mov34/MPN/PAD-1 family protein [Anaerolineae bacterium]